MVSERSEDTILMGRGFLNPRSVAMVSERSEDTILMGRGFLNRVDPIG